MNKRKKSDYILDTCKVTVKKFKCVYCDCPMEYEGSCERCGRKEDVALGKIEEI